jgi:hypothetical protein
VTAWPLRATVRSGSAMMAAGLNEREGGTSGGAAGVATAAANAVKWSRVQESSCSARPHAGVCSAPSASALHAATKSAALEEMSRVA